MTFKMCHLFGTYLSLILRNLSLIYIILNSRILFLSKVKILKIYHF